MEKQLIILRGISGSGKTTLANILSLALGGVAFAADDFFMRGDKYEWSADKLGQAHKWCFEQVENSLLSENIHVVIVHNTLTSEKDLKPYIQLGEKYGAKIISLVVEKRHNSKNVHNVPETTIENQAKKLLNSIKLI